MSRNLILIVDDDANSRILLRDMLELSGYSTCETDTAEDGIRMAGERRPALVLMDVQLPGMSGIEALDRLRADPAIAHIPVIAVTASIMNNQEREIIDAGFDGFERKPISVARLLKTVRAVLERAAPG
jgi:two-component system cell cycle response regulator DivK